MHLCGNAVAGEAATLPHAHAHNDYVHPRPLLDALEQGFCSVEVDIWLVDGKLLVAHDERDIRPDRTLEALYLDPLQNRVRTHGGKIFPEGDRFWLLIDIKSEAEATYRALHAILTRYADILSTTMEGKFEERAVSVVISGNRPHAYIAGQSLRYAGIDGRLGDLDSNLPAHLMPWISDRWTAHFTWNGDGEMPDAERHRLREIVDRAHKRGRLVRFWATPERAEVWHELRAAKVDLIGADQLDKLQKFFLPPSDNGSNESTSGTIGCHAHALVGMPQHGHQRAAMAP